MGKTGPYVYAYFVRSKRAICARCHRQVYEEFLSVDEEGDDDAIRWGIPLVMMTILCTSAHQKYHSWL